MNKNILVLAGLLSLLGLASTASQADTIISVTETHYDANLRPDCVAVRMNPLTFSDAASNACTPKTAIGADGPDRITQSVYDSAGQVLAVYQAVGTSNIRQYAYYNYTPNGLKAFEIDANHNKTTYTYDGFDRLSKIQYPNTTVGNEISSTTDYETYGYDANNNRTNWRRRNGATITYFYDNLNRQTHEGGSSSADMDTAYDLQGRIRYKHFSTGGLGVDYAYDGLGRVISTTDMNGRTIKFGYNAASARTGMIYPDGNNLVYSRDYMNRMTNTRWADGTVMVWQGYNSLGQRRVLDRGAVSGAGGSTAYTYDNLGRLATLANNLTGTSYDVTWTFTGRNPAGQITAWGNSNSLYDYKESAVSIENKTYDGLNRDATIASVTGGYDANGNAANDGARVMKYDFYNRLVSVAVPATPPTTPYLTLNYDPEGRLASYTYAGQITEFLYDGTNLIGEYNHVPGTLHNSDTMAARYVHGDGVDEPLVWYVGSSVASPRFFYSNYQGSIVAYTDANGGVSDYYQYGPYGEPINNNNTGQTWTGPRFRYTGQVMLGEAKLYYYKARVYDPNMGRFLQTDPVGSKDDLDLYAYVAGDPINRGDPDGLTAQDVEVFKVRAAAFVRGFAKEGVDTVFGVAAIAQTGNGMATPVNRAVLNAQQNWVNEKLGEANSSSTQKAEVLGRATFFGLGFLTGSAEARAATRLERLLAPGGEYIGTVVGSATPNIRTLGAESFDALQSNLLKGATPSGTYAKGAGTWYDLPNDMGRVGVRTSTRNGTTLDINIRGFPSDLKVHQQ